MVERTNGSDGRITCEYKTMELINEIQHRAAKAGVDYKHVEGELVFEHHVSRMEIVVPILPREDLDGTDVKRDEVFGVKIFNA